MNHDDFSTTLDLETLERRSHLLRQVRQYFYDRGFWEVETPLLSQETVIDLHLDPIRVPDSRHPDQPRYLQTSPEFGMKRLLACGARAIFQITRAFREGEVGRWHNPEFSMLEWYHIGDDYLAGRQRLVDFINQWYSAGCDQISYRQAMLQFAGLDPFFSSDLEIGQLAQRHGLALSVANRPSRLSQESSCADAMGNEWARRDALNYLWSELVEVRLGLSRPTIVYDWPASEAALAQTATLRNDSGDPYQVAQRFELYASGVELANGYHELLDPDELQARNDRNNQGRVAYGKPPLPENKRLLAAMRSGIPPCCGVALGLDRLAMVLFQKSKIHQVLTFPWDRA